MRVAQLSELKKKTFAKSPGKGGLCLALNKLAFDYVFNSPKKEPGGIKARTRTLLLGCDIPLKALTETASVSKANISGNK